MVKLDNSTQETLLMLRNCVQHNGFTQLLSLQIQGNLNDQQRSQVISDLNNILSNM